MKKLKTGCKPAHKDINAREIIWQNVRELKEFSISDIEKITKINDTTIFSFLEPLVKANILEKVLTGSYKTGIKKTYKLIKDSGLDVPRVKKNGSFYPETNQTKMWKAIRVIKIFTLQDIIAIASNDDVQISATAADDYLRNLLPFHLK